MRKLTAVLLALALVVLLCLPLMGCGETPTGPTVNVIIGPGGDGTIDTGKHDSDNTTTTDPAK